MATGQRSRWTNCLRSFTLLLSASLSLDCIALRIAAADDDDDDDDDAVASSKHSLFPHIF